MHKYKYVNLSNIVELNINQQNIKNNTFQMKAVDRFYLDSCNIQLQMYFNSLTTIYNYYLKKQFI